MGKCFSLFLSPYPFVCTLSLLKLSPCESPCFETPWNAFQCWWISSSWDFVWKLGSCGSPLICPTVTLPFLWKRGAAMNCFLSLVNSLAQVTSQCSSAKAAVKPLLQVHPIALVTIWGRLEAGKVWGLCCPGMAQTTCTCTWWGPLSSPLIDYWMEFTFFPSYRFPWVLKAPKKKSMLSVLADSSWALPCSPLYFSSLTLNKPHFHPCVLPWILPGGTKNLEVRLHQSH
jgi:hypothetical protein